MTGSQQKAKPMTTKLSALKAGDIDTVLAGSKYEGADDEVIKYEADLKMVPGTKSAMHYAVSNAARVLALLDVLGEVEGVLEKAVGDYGKPGGPWNVPSEPGTWITMARQALATIAEAKAVCGWKE